MPVYWADPIEIRSTGQTMEGRARMVKKIAETLEGLELAWALPPDDRGPSREVDAIAASLRRTARDLDKLGESLKKEAGALERLDQGGVSFRAFRGAVDWTDSLTGGQTGAEAVNAYLAKNAHFVNTEIGLQQKIVANLNLQATRLIESTPLPKAEVDRLLHLSEQVRLGKADIKALEARRVHLAKLGVGFQAAGSLLAIVGYAVTADRVRDESAAVYEPVRVMSGLSGAAFTIHPALAVADIPLSVASKAPEQILIPAEALGRLLAGERDWETGMTSLNDHNLAGDNGPVFMGAAYIGEVGNLGITAIQARR